MFLLVRTIFRQAMTVAFTLLFLHFVSSPLDTPVAAYTITLTNPMTGSGDINGTVSCTIGPTGQCITTVANGTELTLAASPDWKSLFVGWGTPCSGTGSCVFTLNADTEVTATFNPNYQAALIIMTPVVEPKFASLADAYGYAQTNGKNNFSLNARVSTFIEDLILSHQINFTLAGGKNSGYYISEGGFTTLQGYLDIQYGSVVVDALIIQ